VTRKRWGRGRGEVVVDGERGVGERDLLFASVKIRGCKPAAAAMQLADSGIIKFES
jgi:hypothetical protein